MGAPRRARSSSPDAARAGQAAGVGGLCPRRPALVRPQGSPRASPEVSCYDRMSAPAAEGAEGDMKLVVDGQTAEVAVGATVLDAVNRLGIALPQLCKDPDRPPLGACRTCLVQVEGQRGAPAACHLPAREGMVVSTTAPEVRSEERRVGKECRSRGSPYH